jgi:hypothetical protein
MNPLGYSLPNKRTEPANMSNKQYLNGVAVTNYELNGSIIDGEIHTQLFAGTIGEAQQIANQRNLGERVNVLASLIGFDGVPDLPSDHYAAGRIAEALHAACWLGFIACKAGVTTGEELLDDNGVIHNLAHLNSPPEVLDAQNPELIRKIKRDIPRKLKALEAKTPGFHKYLTEAEYEAAERRANEEEEREAA